VHEWPDGDAVAVNIVAGAAPGAAPGDHEMVAVVPTPDPARFIGGAGGVTMGLPKTNRDDDDAPNALSARTPTE